MSEMKRYKELLEKSQDLARLVESQKAAIRALNETCSQQGEELKNIKLAHNHASVSSELLKAFRDALPQHWHALGIDGLKKYQDPIFGPLYNRMAAAEIRARRELGVN